MRIEGTTVAAPEVVEQPAPIAGPPAEAAPSAGRGHAHHAPASRRGRVLHFLQHLGEMLVAMTLGMVLLTPVYAAVMAALGYPHPGQRFPEFSGLVMTFNMTVPMVAWMRFRGHDWARSGEMAGAMFAPALVLLPLCLFGVLPHTALSAGVMIAMVPMMVGVMLYRRREYSEHAG